MEHPKPIAVVYRFTLRKEGVPESDYCYVGQTIQTTKKRLVDYATRKSSNPSAFEKALKKYGVNEFEEEVLETVEIGDDEDLQTFEDVLRKMLYLQAEWIAEYKAQNRSFNETDGLQDQNVVEKYVQRIVAKRPFKCRICGFRFPREIEKTEHETGVYRCSFMKCEKSFASKEERDEHRLIHDYICKVCGQAFGRSVKLLYRHLKDVHNIDRKRKREEEEGKEGRIKEE